MIGMMDLGRPRGGAPADAGGFAQRFVESYRSAEWVPHPRYSVFTQFDEEYYRGRKEQFLHKYRCFHAVSRTIRPRKLIELGTHAGSGADAYLSASPDAEYLGLDIFREEVRHDDGSPHRPMEIAEALFRDRGYAKWRLLRTDLRALDRLPESADFVVVDAAHDFENEYADLQLALTAGPRFIFVDDSDDEGQARPAVQKFLNEDVRGRVDYTVGIDYQGGGLVIALSGHGGGGERRDHRIGEGA